MKIKETLIAAALMISCNTLAADRVAPQPFGSIRLTEDACTNPKIVNQLLPQYVEQFKAGVGTVTDPALAKLIGSTSFAFCWTDYEDKIFLVDQFGNSVAIDPADFEPAGPGA